jgi:amino acid transporter
MAHATEEVHGSLRANAVGLPGLIAQSLGVTAPELSAVIIASVVATQALGATPLAFLVAGIGALALGIVYSRFARYVPNAGGTYAIVRAGLGRDVGFFAGWVLLAVGIIFTPALVVASAFLTQNFFSLVLPHATFLSDQWFWWAVLYGAIILTMSFLGVQLSARVLLTLTSVGVVALFIFDIILLAKGGAHGLAWAAFNPSKVSGFKASGFFLGVGIAMTGFSGFETAVFLAEEARAPQRQVPKAVLGAVLLAIVFFVITTFAIVTGYGMNQVAAKWPNDSAGAVVSLSAQFIDLRFGEFLLLLLALSSLASALGTANFTSRVAFSWGRHGYLPRAFGETHPRFKSPHIALGVLATTTLIVYLVGLVWQGNTLGGGLTYFSWLLLCGASGILPVYGLVSIGGFVHGRRVGASLLAGIIAPIVALVIVAGAEWTEFYPVPAAPLKYAPWVMVAWMVVGILLRLATRNRVDEDEEQPGVTQTPVREPQLT